MQPITEAHGTDNGRGWVYRVRTGDGVWYRISKADFDRLAETGGRGCLQVTILPGHEYRQSDDLNVVTLSQDEPEMLETRVVKAKAELDAIRKQVEALTKMLTDAM
jgi:hypothetical protein